MKRTKNGQLIYDPCLTSVLCIALSAKNVLQRFNCLVGALSGQCTQHCTDERNFDASGEMCFEIVIS